MKILVAETSPRIGQKIGHLLTRLRCVPLVCASLSEARSTLQTDKPQILLIDAGLPDGGALELCYLGRQINPTPTIVLMASDRVSPDALALLDYDKKLKKPFTGLDLRNLVASLTIAPPKPAAQAPATPSLTENIAPSPARRPPKNLRTVMHSASSLTKTPFPALLYKLFANRSTGVLRLMRDEQERAIFLVEGEPVYATSSSADDSLSAVLIGNGIISMEVLNATIDARQKGQALGAALLDRGVLTAEQLLEAMERQIHARIVRCFSFSSGAYIFAEGDEWASEVRHFRQNPIQLICDGVHRFVGPNILANQLQSMLSQYVVRTEKYAWFEPFFPITSWRKTVMSDINGNKTLQEMTVTYSADIMDLLRLVWSLHQADMIDFLDAPRTTAERSSHKPPLPTRSPTLQELDKAALAQAIEETRAIPKARKARPSSRRAAVHKPQEHPMAKVVLGYTMRLGKEDHWRLLGISKDATTDEARAALKTALSQLKPDEIATLPSHLRVQAIEVRQALQRAFQTIIEPERRKRYSTRLNDRRHARKSRAKDIRPARSTGTRPPKPPLASVPKAPESRLSNLARPRPKPKRRPTPFEASDPLAHNDPDLEAEHGHALIHLRRAKRAIERHRWKEAYQQAKAASDLSADNAELNILLAWIVYNLPHKDKTRQYRVCRNRIEVELTLDSVMPDAHYYLGAMAEAQGDVLEAIQQFRAALTLAPRHQEARESVERLREHPEIVSANAKAQEEEDAGVVGSFKKLFGRKKP